MDPRYKKRMDRYWAKMRDRSVKSFARLNPDSWFDYWHYHVDWRGKANSKAENRQSSLELGYEILQMACGFASRSKGPIQVWWQIQEHSSEDAIYLHSPNTNETPFPYRFDGFLWGDCSNEKLSKIVNLSQFKIGVFRNEYGVTYVVAPYA